MLDSLECRVSHGGPYSLACLTNTQYRALYSHRGTEYSSTRVFSTNTEYLVQYSYFSASCHVAKYCSILRSSIPILENTLHFQDGMNKRFDDMRLAGGLPPYAGEAP